MTAPSNSRSAYRSGVYDALPFILLVVPFAMLFGVVATEAGFTPLETMGYSVLVIAGAAQFTAVSLMSDHMPTLIVMATALAVNLRMAMYSAALTPYFGDLPLWKRAVAAYVLVDQTYALSVARFEQRHDWGPAARFAYYLGNATPVCLLWYLFTWLGLRIGAAIPDWMALDFAVPICFLAMVGPMLRSPAHIVAALVSAIGALLLTGVPYGLGLLVAALLAMIAGAAVERVLERHQEAK